MSGLRYQVGPVRFSLINRNNLVQKLESFFSSYPTNNFVCVSNVHTTVECLKDLRLRKIQNDSYLTIADGQPIIYYGRISGVTDIDRIMGPDIMTQVFAAPECRDRRHFFLGGSEETLAKMKRNLRQEYPYLQSVGMLSPPFRKLDEEEEQNLRQDILKTKPDYLWVCFGAPKQEYWMDANHSFFPRTLMLGVGAGFAYHAGELERAPLWAQKMACEWIWRLAQDPKRLWKRYLRTNPVFVLLILKLVILRLILRRNHP